MRWLKIFLYFLVVLSLQTVVLARINLFGYVPDLVLVSVVAFAILNQPVPSIFFAAFGGLMQDLLGVALYLNTASKVTFSALTETLKESFGGGEQMQALVLVALFTPFSVLINAWADFYFYSSSIGLAYIFLSVILTTLYNLAMVPLIYPIVKGLLHE